MNDITGRNDIPLLEGKNISKSFSTKAGPINVLSNISLQIYRGEILGIVGASGVGKSTLMHILGGLDIPDSGSVLFKGDNIFSKRQSFLDRFRNNHIGFVFQTFNLLNDFTALENVMFPLMIAKMNNKDAKARSEQLLSQVGLKDRMNHKPGQLSGGQNQRVALARGLVNKPDLLLADEPSGNLDAKNSDSLINLFRQLNQETGQTFVIVTHSQLIAKKLDRVVQLADGEIKPIEKELII